MDGCVRTNKRFRDLIAIRYSPQTNLPMDLIKSDDENGDNEEVTEGMREMVNPIDKGIFPADFKPLAAVPCRFWVRSDQPNLVYDGNPRNRSRPSVRSIRTS